MCLCKRGRGALDHAPNRICDKLSLIEVRSRRKPLPPGPNQRTYAEGIGDRPKRTSDERECGAGKPPAAGIKMGLVVVDGVPPRSLRWLILLGCLGLLAVEGLDVVLDVVTTVGHHLGPRVWLYEPGALFCRHELDCLVRDKGLVTGTTCNGITVADEASMPEKTRVLVLMNPARGRRETEERGDNSEEP